MFNLFRKKREVTLVLGGGSARGIAHIGVLKVLQKEKIPIHKVIGTSMGALIGAAYCVGDSIDNMERKARKFTTNQLLDPTIPRMGLLAGEKLEKVIKGLLDDRTFADCRTPFTAVMTDIQTGEEIIYQKGDLSRIVRASCSWPGIFNPVEIDGRVLCDGGIKNSVPTRIAKILGSDYIIAVDVGFCIKKTRITNIFQMILQSFQIMGEELNKYQANEADAVIKVELGDLDQVAFERGGEAIDKGVQAAKAAVQGIKKDLGIR